MHYAVDLHAHSGYAGGVGDLPLAAVARAMARKGIRAYATGDALHPGWLDRLEGLLAERESGLFALRDPGDGGAGRAARFVLQSEIIVTSDVPVDDARTRRSTGRKKTHVAVLLPGFAAARAMERQLRAWGAKTGMGRPFLPCGGPDDVAERLDRLSRVAPGETLFFPAHVLTPSGVYGSDRPVGSLRAVFGDFADRLPVVETGLSADPGILALIPELDGRTAISNSDAHGAAPNRLGREFTVLDLDGPGTPDYPALLGALLAGRVAMTVELPPSEGKYFLTGHRAGLAGHGARGCWFSPGRAPADGMCPICGRRLTVGVLDRALALARAQAPPGTRPRTPDRVRPRQAAMRLVPLVEAVAAGLGVKSASSKRAAAALDAVQAAAGAELDVWTAPPAALRKSLAPRVPAAVIDAILAVRAGRFGFDPPGHDGAYGALRVGGRDDWFGHAHVDP